MTFEIQAQNSILHDRQTISEHMHHVSNAQENALPTACQIAKNLGSM